MSKGKSLADESTYQNTKQPMEGIMAIKIELTEYEFVRELRNDEYARWSEDAAHALYEYFEALSEDIGDIEFDRVAIRCDWSEMDIGELVQDYGYISGVDADTFTEDDMDGLIEGIMDHTTIIPLDNNNYLVQQF